MSQLSNIPKQSYFTATLQSPIDSSQTTGIILSDVPEYTPSGETVYLNILDPGGKETISCTGWNSGTNVLSGVTRGVDTYTGESASGSAHAAGVTVVLSNDWNVFQAIQTAVNSKADLDSPSFTTDIQVPVYADDTARDAGIPSPSNGMIIYNTADGVFQAYQTGAWADVGNSATANASETVAGKVELATDAEFAAGTDTGGTGAKVVAIPSQIAEAFQNSNFNYIATGGAANAYTMTLVPAVTAYAAGQIFVGKANHANTGAATVNVNGLGVKNIKKANDQDLESGDIEVDQIIVLGYDGTNFQLLSPIATQMSTAAVTALQGGGDASAYHGHFGMFYDDGTNYSYIQSLADLSVNTFGTFTKTGFTTQLSDGGASQNLRAVIPHLSDTGNWVFDDDKNLVVEFWMYINSAAGDFLIGVGDATSGVYNNTTDRNVSFAFDGTTPYARTSDPTATLTDVSSGITTTNWNKYKIEFDADSEARFYINDTLVATHTTNIPIGSVSAGAFFVKTQGSGAVNIQMSSDVLIKIEK